MDSQFRKPNEKPTTTPPSRHPSSARALQSHLLCHDCGELREVTDVFILPYRLPLLTLECGHKRKEQPTLPNGTLRGVSNKSYKALLRSLYRKRKRMVYETQKRRRRAARRLKICEAASPTGPGRGEKEISV